MYITVFMPTITVQLSSVQIFAHSYSKASKIMPVTIDRVGFSDHSIKHE